MRRSPLDRAQPKANGTRPSLPRATAFSGKSSPYPQKTCPSIRNFITKYADALAPANAVEEQLAHAALTFAETLIRSKDPLATLSLYEQRLHRRLLQTLKQLSIMQEARRLREQQDLETMCAIGLKDRDQADLLDPADFGFVCSTKAWRLRWKREEILKDHTLRHMREQNASSLPCLRKEATAA